MKSKILLWIRASRLFAISASVMPVILGGVVAFNETDKFNGLYFVLSLIAIILIHTGANIKNDRDDYLNKVDTPDSFGSSGVLNEKLLKPEQLNVASFLLLSIGSLIGGVIVLLTGWPIIILGMIGVAGGYCYTGKPLQLKYKGLGTPLIFLLFGPLPTLGSYYVQTKNFDIKPILMSIPIGLLTAAILHANDIRDICSDKKAGIRTLSGTIGRENASIIYNFLVIMAPVSLVIMAICNFAPIISIPLILLTLPQVFKNMKKLKQYDGTDTGIIILDKETAKLQTLFGVLLILSIMINHSGVSIFN